MKRTMLLSALVLSLVVLAGCAATTKDAAAVKVKCPACGYQFETDSPRP